MLTINYFASLREQLGVDSESLSLPEPDTDVSCLIEHLVADRSDQWGVLKDNARVLVAVNQTIVDRSCRLKGDEEIAFFPPMTGG
jgi:molybdopterin synthase sulfur carrier subunit